MFKVFPATINHEQQKVPLVKGWQTLATNDQNQINLWRELFKDRLKMFGIPCGQANGIVVLDIDVKPNKKTGELRNGWHSLQKLGYQLPVDTLRQQTPSGGTHLFFRAKEGVHYGNSVNETLGIDVRGDGGWVGYYGFSNASPLAEAPDWLAQLAPAKTHVEQGLGSVIKISPEIAEAMIKTSLDAIKEASPGSSNDTLNSESFKVGQLVASGSISREFAFSELFKAAKERGKPDYEARATINSGLDGGAKKPLVSPFVGEPVPLISIPPPPAKPGRWTPNEFSMLALNDFSKLRKPQLFENWSTEDIHIETADGGTGKTTLKLFESVCLALGKPFLGFQPKQTGKTLFITGEDTAEKLAAMIGRICKDMDLTQEEIEIVRKSVFVKKDADLCLITKSREQMIMPNNDALLKVLEAIEDIKPKMIVFDPIANFWGSESAVNDMARAVIKFMSALVEKSNACVVMINHMGKVSSSSKDMSQFAGRGGTGLPSNSRVSRVLRPIQEDEYQELTGEDLGDRSCIMCVVNKFTDGSPLYNKPFLLLRDNYIFSRKDLSPQKAREAEEQLSDKERVFAFIQEERNAGRYPTKSIIIGRFQSSTDKISKDRIARSIADLAYQSHLGNKIKAIDNPDQTVKEAAYVITDESGVEV